MSEEMGPVEARRHRCPAAVADRSDLDRAARHSRLGVRRVDDHARRVARLLGLEAHRWRGLVDVHRRGAGRAVRLALRPGGVVPGRAYHGVNAIAVNRDALSSVRLWTVACDAAARSPHARGARSRIGEHRDCVVGPDGPARVVRSAEHDAYRVVVHLERLRVGGAESGSVNRADCEREGSATG